MSKAQEAVRPSLVSNNVHTYIEEQDNHPIFNGRHTSTGLHGPPIEIYDKVLATLKGDLRHVSNAPEPLRESINQTSILFRASQCIYDNESRRIDSIINPLSQLMGATLERSVKTHREGSKRISTEGDAAIRVMLKDESRGTKEAIVAYIEFKNEIGQHGDGGLQGALSLRKYVSQTHVKFS